MPNEKTQTFQHVGDLSELKKLMGSKPKLAPPDVGIDWDRLNNGFNAWTEKIKRVVSNRGKFDLKISYWPDLVAEGKKYNKITRVSAHFNPFPGPPAVPAKDYVIFENHNMKTPTTID